MFFEKAEYLTSAYKSRSLSYKLSKMTIYIYIYKKELLFLIIFLNASYGHNIFTKISR